MSDSTEALIGFIFLLGIGIFAIISLTTSMQITEKDITVIEKVPVQPYKIIDENDNMYVIQDQWQAAKFDSGNRYARIKEGKQYHIMTSGMRFPLLSWYPNIIEMTEVTNQTITGTISNAIKNNR